MTAIDTTFAARPFRTAHYRGAIVLLTDGRRAVVSNGNMARVQSSGHVGPVEVVILDGDVNGALARYGVGEAETAEVSGTELALIA